MRLKIEYLKPEQLQPYANNAKLHPAAQVEQIENSIREFDFSDPIGIWGENEVVEGHGRLLAALKLGLKEVPVIRLDHLTDEQRKAYALAHNQTTMTSGWDADKLLKELKDLDGGGLDMTAFGFEPIPENIDDVVEDNYEEPEELETRAKLGDIYILGDHVLMCGSSADAEAQAKLFRGHSPKMVFTDPPYGVSIGDKNKALNSIGRGGKCEENIEGDTLSSDELYKVLVQAFSHLRENAASDASYYVSSPQGGELGLMMMMMMRDAGLPVRHMLIWVKSSPCFSMGRLDYDYRHEPIFYTWTKSHNFYGGYSNTVIDDTKPLEKMTKSELKELVHALQDQRETSVLYCDKPMRADLHPTMKPVKLVARFIINSSREGDTVADIFGGSGTTLIACEQLHRHCRMMELDPHYVDVIIDRWEKFTGQKAELLNE